MEYNCWDIDAIMLKIDCNNNGIEKKYRSNNSECDMFSSCMAMDHCFDGCDAGDCNDN